MNNEYITKMITEIRKKNNLTQKELADVLGVTPQAVSKWERGLNLPDIELLNTICQKYNYDINKALNNRNTSKKYWLIIGILIVFLLGVFIYYQINDSFKHYVINTSCSDFKVYGSIAYHKKQTSIYISEVNYCEDNNILYKKIECILYKTEDNVITKISEAESGSQVTLNDYLQNVSFKVDSNKDDCVYFSNTSFEILINATNNKDEITTYRVPLSVSSSCK